MFVILDRAVGGTDRLGSLSLLQAATEAHLPQKLSVLRVDDFLFYVNSLSVVARNPYLKISVAHPQFWGSLLLKERNGCDMATLVQSLQQVGDEIALCRYPGAVIETLHAAVRPTLNVLGAWRVPRRYEDWSAWRLNYNVFCHLDLPATFFDAWLAGAKENGRSAIAAMATREGGSFTWSECMREANLSAKGRWVFDGLLSKYGMRDGFCCPIGPWILHYWSSKVLDLSPAMRRSLSWAALTAVDQLMKLTTKKRLDAARPASRLTDREREVLRMYAIGSRARTIAYALKISEDTVREHLRHAMIKLDARHLGHAINLAYHGGLLD